MYTIYAWLKDLIFPRFALETATWIAQMAARWVVCIVLDPCCLWFYLFGNIHCLYTITITKHSGPRSSWQFSVKTWRSNWYIVRESGTAFWSQCFFFSFFFFLWKSVSDTLLSHFHFVVIHNYHFKVILTTELFGLTSYCFPACYSWCWVTGTPSCTQAHVCVIPGKAKLFVQRVARDGCKHKNNQNLQRFCTH